MDTYYLSENQLSELLKAAHTKGYHGFLDLADSAVEELLKGTSESKYSPSDVLIPTNEELIANPTLVSVSGTVGGTTITGSGVGPLFDSIVPQDTASDVLPENITLEQETINLNTGDG